MRVEIKKINNVMRNFLFARNSRLNKLVVCCSAFFFLCATFGFSQSSSETHTPVPYTKDELEGWVKQLRRTEIITLGSLPFTMLSVTLGFTLYHWLVLGQSEYEISFDSNTSSSRGLTTFSGFSYDEQIQILTISASISLAIGLADLIWSLIKNSSSEKKRLQNQGLPPNIIVTEVLVDSGGAQKTLPVQRE
ncbi:MAG: hypothetical protein Ta2A_16070 [Treponemataceae bacterium]|nr:MAG: hypothetical protein Ta2A_16070 [Treponemataceae bacterium]